MAAREPERWAVVDALGDFDTVQGTIRTLVTAQQTAKESVEEEAAK